MVKTGNEILNDSAREAIEKLINDQTVTIEETLANLTALIEYLEVWQDTLRTDL